MSLFSDLEQRRAANAKKLEAFGVAAAVTDTGLVKVVREAGPVTIYTIGYERRDGEGLMNALRDQGVRAIADVRERPMSRKPDFRATALRGYCEHAGIEYRSWSTLGSTVELREELQASGDFQKFAENFRSYAVKTMKSDLERLAQCVEITPTALLCYERLHEDCHRCVIADLVAEKINATVVAIQ